MGSIAEHHGSGRTGGAYAGMLIWGALAVCVIAATVYDVGHWITIW